MGKGAAAKFAGIDNGPSGLQKWPKQDGLARKSTIMEKAPKINMTTNENASSQTSSQIRNDINDALSPSPGKLAYDNNRATCESYTIPNFSKALDIDLKKRYPKDSPRLNGMNSEQIIEVLSERSAMLESDDEESK